MPTTKIKASDSKSKRPKVEKTIKKAVKNKSDNIFLKAIQAFLSYFKDSWTELRKVRWPNRRTTWGMTGAVLMFTAFFIVLIVLLDAAFSQLFNLIIK